MCDKLNFQQKEKKREEQGKKEIDLINDNLSFFS